MFLFRVNVVILENQFNLMFAFNSGRRNSYHFKNVVILEEKITVFTTQARELIGDHVLLKVVEGAYINGLDSRNVVRFVAHVFVLHLDKEIRCLIINRTL